MEGIAERLKAVRSELPEEVGLVAVSKFHPAEELLQAYDAGQRDFGESHVQELCQKQLQLPQDIRWHFIGHLQTNKVKYIVPFVSLIHSVDSLKLMREINARAQKFGRIIDCLLQIHVAAEETKFGFFPQECLDMLEEGQWRSFGNVRLRGLMCMATNTDDEVRIRHDFAEARQLFDKIKAGYFADKPEFCLRSYGMSDDYHIAVAEKSDMVRVGTRIFGPRRY